MTDWKRLYTSLEVVVDIDEFDPKQLLKSLIDRNLLSESEAEAILARKSHKLAPSPLNLSNYLEEAKFYIRRGQKSDALERIEHFLGRDWYGMLQ